MNKEQYKELLSRFDETVEILDELCKGCELDVDSCYSSACIDRRKKALQAIIDKTEKRFRPFKSAEELKPYAKMLFKLNKTNTYRFITEFRHDGVIIGGHYEPYRTFMENYTFEDGTPCGVEEV